MPQTNPTPEVAPQTNPTAETVAVTTPEAEAPVPAKPPKTKEEFYRQLSGRLNAQVMEYFQPVADRVKAKTKMDIKLRQVFGDQEARDLVVAMWKAQFDIMLQPGPDGQLLPTSMGIPGGFGSLQLTTAGATKKTTPQGQTVEVKKRWRVKYSPGKTVGELLDQLPPPPPDAPEDGEEGEDAPAPAVPTTPAAQA